MCEIFVSSLEMGNVVYGSFVVGAISIVDMLFSNLLDPISLCGQ